jgi:hypothetical protein
MLPVETDVVLFHRIVHSLIDSPKPHKHVIPKIVTESFILR